ncbi:serine/threonine-protein kinase [Luedemannella flava]
MDVLGGRYRLLDLIGTGGMAVVWRAHDDVLGRPVAVKILSPNLAKDASFRQRIQREARAAARLAHPHISVVHDYGEWTDVDGAVRPYVVMELIDGPSLSDALSAGQLPWYRAAAICAQVAEGLSAAHARGLVHHDIKPANIVLSTTGPKIVDFGISAIVGEQDEEGAVFGTPGFVAPERISGHAIEPAADVYALGLTLYRCIAGKAPWPATTAESLLFAHAHTPPAPLPTHDAAGTDAEIPAELIDICDRCLAKDPAARPTAGELAEVLGALPVPEAATRRRPAVRPARITGDNALNVTSFLPGANDPTGLVAPPPRRRGCAPCWRASSSLRWPPGWPSPCGPAPTGRPRGKSPIRPRRPPARRWPARPRTGCAATTAPGSAAT